MFLTLLLMKPAAYLSGYTKLKLPLQVAAFGVEKLQELLFPLEVCGLLTAKESKALEQKGTFALISGRLGYEHSNVKRPTWFEGLYSPHTGKFDITSCALRGAIGYKMPLGNAVFTPTSYLENALGVRTSLKRVPASIL